MKKVICMGTKGENLVIGYTVLEKLDDRQDPERNSAVPMAGGIEKAVLGSADILKKEGVIPIRVRDYVDDRYGVVEDKYKEMLMGCF